MTRITGLMRFRPTATVLACLILTSALGAPRPSITLRALAAPAAAEASQVYTQPGAGDGPLLDAISRAKSAVWVEAYVLTHHKLVLALGEAVRRGVQVRVLLEQHPYGEGGPRGPAPEATYRALRGVGADVRWTDPAFGVTHTKAVLIDDSTAIIGTANFTPNGFSMNNHHQREFAIIDSRRTVVDALSAVFTADWFRTPLPQQPTSSLVVSPHNARAVILETIGTARQSLCIETEQVSDPGVQNALYAARQRGVKVRIILPKRNRRAPYAALHLAEADGIAARVTVAINMHAKLIVADGARALVGSQNLASTALDKHREIGVLVDDPTVVASLTRTFELDWNAAALRLT